MGFTLPSRDLHARHVASGLTRYTFEQIEEVAAAFAVVEREFHALTEEVEAAVAPHKQDYPFWEVHAPAHVQELLYGGSEQDRGAFPHLETGSMSNELFPVKKWWRDVAAYRALNKRTRKAIEKFRRAE